MIRVEQGKGRKDRHAILSPQLRKLLRAWWREGKRSGEMLPQHWLFPGRNPTTPFPTRQMSRSCRGSRQDQQDHPRVHMICPAAASLLSRQLL
jgi:integrase/recombinase XerD